VLRTGGAVITPGFNLPAKHVIHCVGPIFEREGDEAPGLLESCYRGALAIARSKELASITFPSISTGVYGYPVDRAAPIALGAVIDELRTHGFPSLVRFSLFDANIFDVYKRAGESLLQ
jgi:O-acetyl-ADP-ribose deacetylase (regulator of RNase III)